MIARVFSVTAGALLVTSAHAASTEAMPAPQQAACEAAEQLIGSPLAALGSPPKLSSDAAPPFRGGWKRARELRRGGWSGAPPTAALLDKWEASSGLNATVCANVRSLAVSGSEQGHGVQSESHVVGLPVVNHVGTEAIAQVTTNRSPLGGSIYLFLLRKSDGRWTVVSRRMLLIS